MNRLTWPPRRNNVNKRRDWNEDSAAIDDSKKGHLISLKGKKEEEREKESKCSADYSLQDKTLCLRDVFFVFVFVLFGHKGFGHIQVKKI